MMEEWYWLFRNKKAGWVTVSRHSRPDFVQGIPEDMIHLHFDRLLVRFPHHSCDMPPNTNKEGK